MGSNRPAGRGADAPGTDPLAGPPGSDGGISRALRLRLILIVAVVCAAVWLSTLFDTVQDRKATLAMAERQHDNITGALAEQAARALQATDLILSQAALLDPDAPGSTTSSASISDLLRRHMSGVPQVRNLFLFDPGRQLHVSSATIPAANADLSDRSYYMVQRDQPQFGLFMSEPFISRVTGEPTFVLSRRLPGITCAASTRPSISARAVASSCCAATASRSSAANGPTSAPDPRRGSPPCGHSAAPRRCTRPLPTRSSARPASACAAYRATRRWWP
jgi:hypothetical protein